MGICAAIDTAANYASLEPKVGVKFETFIKDYFPEKYKDFANIIYEKYRCKNVHMWHLQNVSINGLRKYSGHMCAQDDGVIRISLYDLYDDFKNVAFNKFLLELATDASRQEYFRKAYKNRKK